MTLVWFAAIGLVSGCATAPVFKCPEGADARWSTEQALPPLGEKQVAVCVRPDGTPQGPFVTWLGGRLAGAGHYDNGELDGTVFIWETTGRKLQMAEYEHGELRVRVGWDDAGMRTYEEIWQPGSTRSLMRMWHGSGALRSVGGTDGVNLDGPYEYWHESGELGARGRFDAGSRAGSWTCWDGTGSESVSAEYDASGKLVSGMSQESEVPEWARRCFNGCRGGESAAAQPTGCGQPRS